MKLHRIYGVILRHMYLFRRSYDRKVDAFYWITLDLLLWGITGTYFQSISGDTQNIIFMIISGVLLWNVAYRTQMDMNMSILEELWNKNLINIFVAPLTFRDWIASLIGIGVTKSLISFAFGSVIAYFLYQVGIYTYSYHLFVFMFLLLMTGWWLGFFISGIILHFGTRVQALAWTLVWIMSPFSALYYPLETLPEWAQAVSRLVPTSYIFEEGRNLLYNNEVNYSALAISFVLNLIYLFLGFLFLRKSFEKVLQKGLVKVY